MFPSPIKKVAVLGSGVMGSQIAAHITNAGVPVVLLDIVPKDVSDRNALAKNAAAVMQKAEPSPFMHPDNAKLITPGNLEDDLDKIADADWILEAVLENLQVKTDLYKKIDAVRRPGSFVSSNTSTIPLGLLIKDQSERFAHDFLITHFFNPPRTMRLLELVAGEKTSPNVARVVGDFCDRALGKGVVVCKDSPGFIANRLGIFFLQCAENAAFDLGLSVEEADAVFSKPTGMPKTGVFGLIDLIGLDLMPLIAKNFLATLPKDDPYRALNIPHPLIDKMIADGYTGRKGKGGFYRVKKTEAGKVIEAIDLKTGEYSPSKAVKPESIEKAAGNLRALCEAPDALGKFAWTVLSEVLAYAASVADQIADDIPAIDVAMRWGFNWKFGPFELIDKVGGAWLAERLKAEGRAVPQLLRQAAGRPFYRVEGGKLEFLSTGGDYRQIVRPEGVLLLEDIKRASKPVLENGSAGLWDVGDGILCFEFHTKMNTIDENTLSLLRTTVATIEGSGGKYKGLVIYNEADLFSAGVNLKTVLSEIEASNYELLEDVIRQGQETFHALRFARFPTVAAPSGLALGGGCEITLHCPAAQAHAETYIGLVEVNIGFVPGWGGCTQTLGRAFADDGSGDSLAPVLRAFETISHAKRSKSAFEARDFLYLRQTDGITMNRDRLLFDAKQRALQMTKNYKPPEFLNLNLPGAAGRTALGTVIEDLRAAGKALPHDVTVLNALAAVLCGPSSPATEAQLLESERREFVKLGRTPETKVRIAYMLKTGKPLRN